ncbi:SET domain-containing protein [Rostrohypoxylon terebratum]|nr:SET domain-containing protein [Rostrohypoxylon terebratum]
MSRFLFFLQLTFVLASLPPHHQAQQTCANPNSLLTLQLDSCALSKAERAEVKTTLDESASPRTSSKTWRSSGFCRGSRIDKFCVFTNPSFNYGEGVSVVTTGKSISTIATRPAFQIEKDLKPEPIPTPYREAQIPGKDIGLVATRTIEAGELLMARIPALMVNENAIEKLGKKTVSELLIRAVDDLPFQHRQSLLNLSTHSAAKDYGDKIYRILQTNSFRTGYHDGDNAFYSLFTEVSRINHDCRPNCAYYFDHLDFRQKVVAVREIAVGEELTIAYYDPLQIRSVRQDKLLKEWGFHCACQRCSMDAPSIAESDSRVKQIIALRNELDDHSATPEASPQKAELLISLYKEEGILTRVNEAYYRAAIEYIGVGDAKNAAVHAKLCVDHGLKFIGPDRPFVNEMQELIANPTKHPKWKFCLKN